MPPGAADIILVEDNAHDAELALYALSKRNLAQNVVVLRDGAEALEYLLCTGAFSTRRLDDLPRLVLLDLKLPKIDGTEILHHMKADHRLSRIPVVMLTSSREERDISECYRLGANSYVVKPVDFELFVSALQSIGSYWLGLNEQVPSAGAAFPAEGTP